MEFLSNKYTKWYYSIVNNANSELRRKGNGMYYEKHHIIPKCKPFCGSSDKTNLVLLTSREHFLCHWLLIKMCVGEYKWKMQYAIKRMFDNRIGNSKYTFSKIHFNIARKQASEGAISRAKTRGWPMEGKKHSEEAKIKMRNAKLGKSRPDLTVEQRGRRQHSTETKLKIRNSLMGRIVSEETKKKLHNSQVGKSQNKTIGICECCGAENYITQIKRYHNENCKNR